MEIERKWHMLRAPELPALTHTMMYQSYLSLTPQLRIRKYTDLMHGAPDTFDLTVKSEGILAREEIIKPLTEEEYNILLAMAGDYPPIVKDHRTYDWQGHTLEFSVVDPERPEGFPYAEIEFDTIEAAKAFQAPEWFGEEITEKAVFRMRAYWRETRLDAKH